MNLNNENIVITRTAQGSYVNGHYVPGDPEEHDAKANIQPLNPRELLQLPEGDRERAQWKCYTAFSMKNGDIVTRENGLQYKTHDVTDWTGHRLPHYKCRLVLIEEQ